MGWRLGGEKSSADRIRLSKGCLRKVPSLPAACGPVATATHGRAREGWLSAFAELSSVCTPEHPLMSAITRTQSSDRVPEPHKARSDFPHPRKINTCSTPHYALVLSRRNRQGCRPSRVMAATAEAAWLLTDRSWTIRSVRGRPTTDCTDFMDQMLHFSHPCYPSNPWLNSWAQSQEALTAPALPSRAGSLL
jgi:hypothetical protein